MQPLVSVVIPVFNGMPYLADAWTSVKVQSHENLDVVFVDGGSSDSSLEWLREIHDPRVRVESLPKGTSAAQNWTHATVLARGDFIKLLCQDDILYPTAIADQLQALATSPNASMVASKRDIINAHGQVLFKARGLTGLREGVVPGKTALVASYLAGTNIFGEPLSVLFSAASLKSAMPWDDSRPFLLDLDLYTRVLRQADLVVAEKSAGAFRVSTSSWSTRLAAQQRIQLRAWQQELEHDPSFGITAIQRVRARFGLSKQQVLRRLAYRFIALKGGMS